MIVRVSVSGVRQSWNGQYPIVPRAGDRMQLPDAFEEVVPDSRGKRWGNVTHVAICAAGMPEAAIVTVRACLGGGS